MRNRDMFYQNVQTSYQNPGMIIPPSGYNMNAEYQSYGPNVLPNQNLNYQASNDYEERLQRIERQIKSLDTRISKLENTAIDNNDNFYMI